MATLSSVLGQIRANESGGNYTAQNPNSTASGGYQFINSTWQNLTSQSGIGTQYATAKDAPPNIQDAVAAYALTKNPNANSCSLWGTCDAYGNVTGPARYPIVDYQDVTPGALAEGTSGAIPTTDGSGQQYQILGPDGTPQGLQYGTSTEGLPPGYSVGGPAGTPATGNNPNIGPGSLGADVGYVPPASTGGPEATGLSPGAASTIAGVGTSIGGSIGNAITGVGTTFKNFFEGWLASLENWVGRGFLILIGLVLLAIALWRVMDPDGSKAQAALRGAEVAA